MRPAALFALALLAACSKPDNAQGPGGVTVGEAKALDEAAQMIDARALPSSALPPASPGVSSPPSATSQPAPLKPVETPPVIRSERIAPAKPGR